MTHLVIQDIAIVKMSISRRQLRHTRSKASSFASAVGIGHGPVGRTFGNQYNKHRISDDMDNFHNNFNNFDNTNSYEMNENSQNGNLHSRNSRRKRKKGLIQSRSGISLQSKFNKHNNMNNNNNKNTNNNNKKAISQQIVHNTQKKRKTKNTLLLNRLHKNNPACMQFTNNNNEDYINEHTDLEKQCSNFTSNSAPNTNKYESEYRDYLINQNVSYNMTEKLSENKKLRKFIIKNSESFKNKQNMLNQLRKKNNDNDDIDVKTNDKNEIDDNNSVNSNNSDDTILKLGGVTFPNEDTLKIAQANDDVLIAMDLAFDTDLLPEVPHFKSLEWDFATNSWYDKDDPQYVIKRDINYYASKNRASLRDMPQIIINNLDHKLEGSMEFLNIWSKCLPSLIQDNNVWSQITDDDIIDYKPYTNNNIYEQYCKNLESIFIKEKDILIEVKLYDYFNDLWNEWNNIIDNECKNNSKLITRDDNGGIQWSTDPNARIFYTNCKYDNNKIIDYRKLYDFFIDNSDNIKILNLSNYLGDSVLAGICETINDSDITDKILRNNEFNTGNCARIFLNPNGQFIKNNNEWYNLLSNNFNTANPLGYHTKLDFQYDRQTFTIWIDAPKIKNDNNFNKEIKLLLNHQIGTPSLDVNKFIKAARSNRKKKDRIYIEFEGNVPETLPTHLGLASLWKTQVNLVQTNFTEFELCMKEVPYCTVCRKYGHYRGLACGYVNKTLSAARNKINKDNTISRNEKNKLKRNMWYKGVGCSNCGMASHTTDHCPTPDAPHCASCGSHDHDSEFNLDCLALQRRGLIIYEYKKYYELAKNNIKKAPPKPTFSNFSQDDFKRSDRWLATNNLNNIFDNGNYQKLTIGYKKMKDIIDTQRIECELLKQIKISLPQMKDKNELKKLEKLINNIKQKYNMTYNEKGKLIKSMELNELHNSIEQQTIGLMTNTLKNNKLDNNEVSIFMENYLKEQNNNKNNTNNTNANNDGCKDKNTNNNNSNENNINDTIMNENDNDTVITVENNNNNDNNSEYHDHDEHDIDMSPQATPETLQICVFCGKLEPIRHDCKGKQLPPSQHSQQQSQQQHQSQQQSQPQSQTQSQSQLPSQSQSQSQSQLPSQSPSSQFENCNLCGQSGHCPANCPNKQKSTYVGKRGTGMSGSSMKRNDPIGNNNNNNNNNNNKQNGLFSNFFNNNKNNNTQNNNNNKDGDG